MLGKTMTEVRAYQESDAGAVRRIWREIGWIEGGNERHQKGLDVFLEACQGLVGVLGQEAECYVGTAPGTVQHLRSSLPLSVVTAVTTSHIARRQRLALRLTARAVATAASNGAMVSALGMFEQGFYDRLGFGTGSYEHWVSFDPADLRVPGLSRPPLRLTADDWQAVHQQRLSRWKCHGACNLEPAALSHAEMLWGENPFGLGYRDARNGELSHQVWFEAKDLENGPYSASLVSYQTPKQLLELMAVMASLGDQVHLIKMREPAGIQLQDLLKRPFRRRRISLKTEFETTIRADAYWQMRICDLPGCIAAMRLEGEDVAFNLSLADPIEDHLDTSSTWRGVAGEYVVRLGSESSAERGRDSSLPRLEASVGAFTRLWLGVLPASGLAVTDDLRGPPPLLEDLAIAVSLPAPRPDWDF